MVRLLLRSSSRKMVVAPDNDMARAELRQRYDALGVDSGAAEQARARARARSFADAASCELGKATPAIATGSRRERISPPGRSVGL